MKEKKRGRIRDYWDRRAMQKHAASGEVTHSDIWQRWLEIEMISRCLRKPDRVLDVGCGNGHSTRIFSGLCREIIGIDYSSEMIERALRETRKKRGAAAPSFEQCDVLELDAERFGRFDVAVSERCLINLDSFEKQKKAIANIASVLKKGGRYIFVEGSADGRERLNSFRKSAGLRAMPRVWYNLDFREADTIKFLKRFFSIEHYAHFGMYDFISRVVHPLMVSPDEPQYGARINEVAARLAVQSSEFGDISRVLFLVLKRK